MNRGHFVPEAATRRRGAHFALFTTLTLILTLLSAAADAANYYVKSGGTGLQDGSSWSSAFADVPSDKSFWSTVGSGDVIYVAGGTYSSGWEIQAGGSSGSPLTIRRATAKDHGTDQGWSSAFDSQVVLKSGISLEADHIAIDGAVENGIKLVVPARDRARGVGMDGAYGGMTIRYLDIVGPGMDDAHNTRGIDLTPNKGSSEGVLIEHCDIHDISNGIYAVNIDDVTVQNTSIRNINNSGTIHENAWFAQGVDNAVFRWNRVERTTACGVFLRADTHNWDVYGNLFLNADMGVVTKRGYSHTDIRVYNNTFVEVEQPVAFKDDGDDAKIYNNIFYPSDDGVIMAKSVEHDYNWYGGSSARGETNGVAANGENPFANSGKGDYRLGSKSTAAARGKTLGGSYAGDASGAVRPQGIGWDIGAYEASETRRSPIGMGGGSAEGTELVSPSNGDIVDMEPVMFEWIASIKRMFPNAFTLVIGRTPELDGPKVKRIKVNPETVGGETTDTTTAAVAGMMGALLMGSVTAGVLQFRRKRHKWVARIGIAGIAILAALFAGCSSNPVTSSSNEDKVHIEQPVKGLAKGETYYWKVVSTDGSGSETASEIRMFKVQ